MEKLSFDAPKDAPAHLALLEGASKYGLDTNALRRLLWLINGHPLLIAHAQVFARLSTLLRTNVFMGPALGWAGRWQDDVSRWVELCDWMQSERQCLARQPGLGEFDRQPRHSSDHPQMNHGVIRHGIGAALWNPVQPDCSFAAEERYEILRSHLLAGYIDCRHRLSSQEFYEGYAGRRERPVAPVLSSSISPAIREFSLSCYAPLLEAFPVHERTPEYANSISRELPLVALIASGMEVVNRAETCVKAIRNYFHHFLRVLAGRPRSPGMRRGSGGGGRRDRHPGFVSYVPDSGVFEREDDTLKDPDLSKGGGNIIFLDQSGRDIAAEDELEVSGISTEENFEPCMALYSPAELGQKFLEVQRQRVARETRTQSFSFNYADLTPTEICLVWERCNDRIDAYLGHGARTQDGTNEALAGLALQLSLAFGQPLETIRALDFAWQLVGVNPEDPAGESPDSAKREFNRPALILDSPVLGDLSGAKFAGLRLPAIKPDYRSELPPELDEIGRPCVESFDLPDCLGIGMRLLPFLQLTKPTPGRPWTVEQAVFRKSVRKILASLGDERITPEKISRVLGNLILLESGDQTLAWVTTANQSRRSEPRMHYTQYRLSKVIRAHFNASALIGQYLRLEPLAPLDETARDLEADAWVGARFVLQLEICRDLLCSLTEALNHQRLDRKDLKSCAQYHNRFLLYATLFQALATSMRATRTPDTLYRTWLVTGGIVPGGILAPLDDKDDDTGSRSRLGIIDAELIKQFEYLQAHNQFIRSDPTFGSLMKFAPDDWGPFFLVDGRGVEELAPKWISQALDEWYGDKIPANWARGFLRTELLERACPAVAVDAFLGHANLGESPFSPTSSFDYRKYRQLIESHLDQIHRDIGLIPIGSCLIRYAERAE